MNLNINSRKPSHHRFINYDTENKGLKDYFTITTKSPSYSFSSTARLMSKLSLKKGKMIK